MSLFLSGPYLCHFKILTLVDLAQLLKTRENRVGEICWYIFDFQRTAWWISNKCLLSEQMNDLAYSLLFTLSACKVGMWRLVISSSFLPPIHLSIHHPPIDLFGLWSCSQWDGRAVKLAMTGKKFPNNKSLLRTLIALFLHPYTFPKGCKKKKSTRRTHN